MKLGYLLGTAALMSIGMMVGWGVHEYFSLKSQLKEIQSNSPTVAQAPSPQPINSTPATSPIASQTQSSPAAQVNFDDLPLCDQLDAITKAGKSVAQFVIASGRYSEFAAQVNTKCNWNAEQLKQADHILHPPVRKVARQSSTPARQATEVSESSASSSSSSQPRHTPWNNCNGIQEPGESYSAKCDAWQRQSDRTGVIVPGDNRSDSLRGEYPHCQGVSCHIPDDMSQGSALSNTNPPNDQSGANSSLTQSQETRPYHPGTYSYP